jgi:hypothetical protein
MSSKLPLRPSSEPPSLTEEELTLSWEIRQTLESLRAAIHTVNTFKTAVEFLDSFPDLTEKPMEIQNAVNTVEQSYQDQKVACLKATEEARTVFKTLSQEEQRSMMVHYGEDLEYYLKIMIPLDLLGDVSEEYENAQISLYETESAHRKLARVRGIVATINGLVFGSTLNWLIIENRKEERELLGLRADAEERLQGQFFNLKLEEQDQFWLWYKDFTGMNGILKDSDGEYYSPMG